MGSLASVFKQWRQYCNICQEPQVTLCWSYEKPYRCKKGHWLMDSDETVTRATTAEQILQDIQEDSLGG